MTFLGAWQVSEYVYTAEGALAGVARQLRRLTRLENGDLRVWQWCAPCEFDHPLGARVGEYVFDLRPTGRARRYLGPDVIGSGWTWGEGAVTGQGLWPRFGHTFTSFSVQTGPARQITGGKFFRGGVLAANIAGLAAPEGEGASWPEFTGPVWPGDVAAEWRGTRRVVAADGVVLAEHPVLRRYHAAGWETLGPEAEQVQLSGAGPSQRLTLGADLHGLARQSGWLWEAEAHDVMGVAVGLMEVLDNAGGQVIGLRRWWRDEAIFRVEVVRLTPA